MIPSAERGIYLCALTAKYRHIFNCYNCHDDPILKGGDSNMLFHVELVLSGPLAPNKINLEGMWNKILLTLKKLNQDFFFQNSLYNPFHKAIHSKVLPTDWLLAYVSAQ